VSKSKKPDINQLLLKAHKLGVKKAIEASARSKTSLIVYENGKVKSVKPKFKYVRVPVKTVAKKKARGPRLVRQKN
jgi:hypothetical protein